MNEQEQNNRVEALSCAVRHRLKDESPDDCVEAAQKYFDFLQGGEDSKES